jgi:hypothetical protein
MTDRADIEDGLTIPATLQISAEARRRAAASFVKHVIVPTITAAFETHPELDVAEVLNLCVPALADELAREMRHARQQLIAEIRKRPRL